MYRGVAPPSLPGSNPPRVPEWILKEMGRDEQNEHKHHERGSQPKREQPRVLEGDEDDRRDDRSGRGEHRE